MGRTRYLQLEQPIMYILHTHWHPPTEPNESGVLHFWAETALVEQPPRYKRGTKEVLVHPFVTDAKTLRQILLPLTGATVKPKRGEIALLLPTTLNGPQPSPGLLHDWKLDRRSKVTLIRWRVPGLQLSPVDGIEILTHLPANFELPPNVRLGDDLRFWEMVTLFALEVVAQQKILPTFAQANSEGNDYHARWMPVVDGPRDAPRVARLVDAMPPLSRAEAENVEGAEHPRHLLDSYLNELTDGLARQWGNSNFPALPSQSGQPAHSWIRSLFLENPAVKAANAQLQRFQNSYYAWLRNLHVAGDRTVRVAFRLEAPLQQSANQGDGENGSIANRDGRAWLLHFLLQARDDPSLLISADDVWKTRSNALRILDRSVEQPQEKLLTGLGYSARLFAPLQRSLQGAKPRQATLSTDEAYTFLRQTAPLLEESGFGVLIPPWWNKPGSRLGVRLRMQGNRSTNSADAVPANQSMTLEKLVNYRWEISLGETTLTKEEFDALVGRERYGVEQDRGRWSRK